VVPSNTNHRRAAAPHLVPRARRVCVWSVAPPARLADEYEQLLGVVRPRSRTSLFVEIEPRIRRSADPRVVDLVHVVVGAGMGAVCASCSG
jgi:hypothetical protein